MTQDILKAIAQTRVIAIVRLQQYDRAVEIVQALVAGGITAIEFTLTGAGANEAIRKSRLALGEAAQIGVGTVLNIGAAHAAADCGAQFVVTPVYSPAVIHACFTAGVPILCGAQTATEAFNAHQDGAQMVKIFPARAGGPGYIKDILAPLPFLRLVPTGGISAENARAFIDAGATAVGIGGNLVSAIDVAASDWAAMTAKARACADAVK